MTITAQQRLYLRYRTLWLITTVAEISGIILMLAYIVRRYRIGWIDALLEKLNMPMTPEGIVATTVLILSVILAHHQNVSPSILWVYKEASLTLLLLIFLFLFLKVCIVHKVTSFNPFTAWLLPMVQAPMSYFVLLSLAMAWLTVMMGRATSEALMLSRKMRKRREQYRYKNIPVLTSLHIWAFVATMTLFMFWSVRFAASR